MKTFKYSVIALSLAVSSANVLAKSIAITHATLHTATSAGVIKDATLVITDGKISAVNPANFTADKVIDAQGKIVTPGLIGSLNQLGLTEVSAVAGTRDAGDKKADITFDASTAFNSLSTVIPYTRKGGITRDVIVPWGGDDIFKGQIFVADLSSSFDSVSQVGDAILASVGAKSKGSRAYDWQQLDKTLQEAKDKLAKVNKKSNKKAKKDDKKPSEKTLVLNGLLNKSKKLVLNVDRASDILQAIKLKQKFDLNMVIVGAADAPVVAHQLALAQVPVVINGMSNLPDSFDSMHNSLENAALLTQAKVKVGLAINDTHNLYQLRFDAGNAAANGLTKAQALATVTSNVAEMFDINAGQLAEGKIADVVMWNGDPLDLSGSVAKMWINGEPVSTKSRHDALRERYTTKSDYPVAYTK